MRFECSPVNKIIDFWKLFLLFSIPSGTSITWNYIRLQRAMRSDVPERSPLSFCTEIFVVIPPNRYRFAQFHYKSDCNFVEMQDLPNSITEQWKVFIVNYSIIIAVGSIWLNEVVQHIYICIIYAYKLWNYVIAEDALFHRMCQYFDWNFAFDFKAFKFMNWYKVL